MNATNLAILARVAADLAAALGPALATLAAAHAEGRDVTAAELDAAFADNDHARAALDAAIAAA